MNRYLGVDRNTNVCSTVPGKLCQKPGAEAHRLLPFSAPNPGSEQGEHVGRQGATGGVHRPSTARMASPSQTSDLERTVLALASNAEDYWTTQEIADFVGRSKRQIYRILARRRDRSSGSVRR